MDRESDARACVKKREHSRGWAKRLEWEADANLVIGGPV